MLSNANIENKSSKGKNCTILEANDCAPHSTPQLNTSPLPLNSKDPALYLNSFDGQHFASQ